MNSSDTNVNDCDKEAQNPPTQESLNAEQDIQDGGGEASQTKGSKREGSDQPPKKTHNYTKLMSDGTQQAWRGHDGTMAMSTDDTSSTLSLGSSSPSQESTWSLGSNSPIHASSIAAAIYPARQLCMNILSEFSRNAQSGKRKRTLSDSELDKNAKQDEKTKDRQRRHGSPTLVSRKSEQINTRKKAKYPWQIKGTSGSGRHRKLHQRKIAFQNILTSSQGAIIDKGPYMSRKRCYSDSENGKMKDAKNKKREESVEYLDIDSKQEKKSVAYQRAGPSNVNSMSGHVDTSSLQIPNGSLGQNNRVGFTGINPRDHPHLYEQSTIGGLKLLAQLSANKSLMPQGALRFPELRPPRLSSINPSTETRREGISNTQSTSDQQQTSSTVPQKETNSASNVNTEETASLPSTNDQNDNNSTDAGFLQKWQNQHLAKAVVDNAINKTLEELGLSPSPGNPNTTAFRRQRRNVENAGVSALIRTRGLRRHSADRMRRMQPIVHRLTQVSENIFAQNMFGPRTLNPRSSQNGSDQRGNRPPTLRRSASATEVIPNVSGSGNVDNTDSASSTYSVSSTPAREFDNSFDLHDCHMDMSLQSVNATLNCSRDDHGESDTDFIDSNSEDEEHNADLASVNLEEVSCEDVIPEDVSVPHYEENPRHDILDQAINAAICERGLLLD